MKILFPLTDWKCTKAKRGRNAGQEITTRYILGYDQWCWNISLQYKNQMVFGLKFYKGFCNLLNGLSEFKIHPIPVITQLLKTLVPLNTHDLTIDKDASINNIGVQIDKHFSVNFNLHDFVHDKLKNGCPFKKVGDNNND